MTYCHTSGPVKSQRHSGFEIPGRSVPPARGAAYLEPSDWLRTRPIPSRLPRCTCRCRRLLWSHRQSSERPLPSRCHTDEDTPRVRKAQLPQLPALNLSLWPREIRSSYTSKEFQVNFNFYCTPRYETFPPVKSLSAKGEQELTLLVTVA